METLDFYLFQLANPDSIDSFDVNLFLYPKIYTETDLKEFQRNIIEHDIELMILHLENNNIQIKSDIKKKSNFSNIITRIVNHCVDYRKSIHYKYYKLLYTALTGDSLAKNQFLENIDLGLLKKIRIEVEVPLIHKRSLSEKVIKFVPELFLNLDNQEKQDIINADLEILKKHFKIIENKKLPRIINVIELLEKYTDKNKNKTIYEHYFKKLRKYCVNSSTIEIVEKPERNLANQSDGIKSLLERLISMEKPPFLSELEFRALENYFSLRDESIFSNYGKSQIFNRVILKLFFYKDKAVEYFKFSEEEEQALNDNFAEMGMGEDFASEDYFEGEDFYEE